MKPNTHKNSLILTTVTRRAASRMLAVAMAATLTLGALSPVFGDAKAKATKTAALTEDQKITHLLNRIGFGARKVGRVVQHRFAAGRAQQVGQFRIGEHQPAPERDAVGDGTIPVRVRKK